jgi:3-dehydroquinate synthase
MKTIDLKGSKILIKKGVINHVAIDIKHQYPNAKALIVTDKNVERLYLKKLSDQFSKQSIVFDVLSFKSGEKTKSFDSLKLICEKAADMNLNRGDIIVALGGGVIGDLAGFASAVYLRGLKFIAIPTTLLSQVDSSVGGKTGINIAQGKNLVGSFYKANSVYIDTQTLSTLDDDEYKCGMAEVIKYGLIWDRAFHDFLLSLESKEDVYKNIDKIVHRCCKIKADVVYQDEFDKGLRMLLNFGHTIGHAIENSYGYGEFSHGEAVSIGMAMISKKSEMLGLTTVGTHEKVIEILEHFGLKTQISNINEKEIFKATMKDKKNIGENMNIILLDDIGKAKIYKIAPKEMVNFI